MTSVHSELTRFTYSEYLNSMSLSELAYWLVNSFSPERYCNPDDVVEFACRLLVNKSARPEISREFVFRLWGMFGLEPEPMDFAPTATILMFRKRDDKASHKS